MNERYNLDLLAKSPIFAQSESQIENLNILDSGEGVKDARGAVKSRKELARNTEENRKEHGEEFGETFPKKTGGSKDPRKRF